MNTFKKTKVLLASTILAALTGCGSEDYTPEATVNTSAPTHGGDISVSLFEKDPIEFVDLLGTPTGAATGDGVAFDADGNYLTVTDIVISLSGPKAEQIGEIGVVLQGNQVGIRSTEIAPLLDTDETHTIVVSFNISDGQNKTPRTATFTIEGEDFAPVAVGDNLGNFTRDAGSASVDMLLNVSDADGEELTISNVTPSSDNPFMLPVTLNGTMLDIDISAIENQIPDGQKVAFEFTYSINDHRFTIERNLTVNVLGVQDVAGAPLVTNYFKAADMNETDGVLVIDLTDEIVEREGDPIMISAVMLDGDALPYGYDLDGNTLTIDPHAFFNDVNAGEFITHKVTYKVSDDQGNESDGLPELSVVINGEQTNLIAETGFSADFEDPANVGPLDSDTNPGGFNWGWAGWACPAKEIRTESARSGDYGMLMEGSFCHFEIPDIIPALEDNQKYVMSYWLRNESSNGNAGNPYVPIIASVGDSGLDNRFWLGSRYFDQSLNKWMEHAQIINSNDSGNWDGYEGMAIHFGLLKYDDSYAGGRHDLDDFSMVKFGHFDTAAHDMIVDDFGLFENSETIVSDAGTVAIMVVNGMNKLYVDTTGTANGVTVTLPIKAGAIKTGGRYAVSMNAQLINHDEKYGVDSNTQVVFDVSLSNGMESIASNGNGSTWGASENAVDVIITEEFGRTADIDWSQETLTLNIRFAETDAQYYVDNIRLIAIP